MMNDRTVICIKKDTYRKLLVAKSSLQVKMNKKMTWDEFFDKMLKR